MTEGRHGLQFLELRKPEGMGLESWRRLKRLISQHPAGDGVLADVRVQVTSTYGSSFLLNLGLER